MLRLPRYAEEAGAYVQSACCAHVDAFVLFQHFHLFPRRGEAHKGTLLINANRNLEDYARFGLRVIPDRMGEFFGPLVGMASALEVSTTPYLLTVPCDSPLIPADLAARLYQKLREEDAEISVVHDGERMQPVFALLQRELLPSLLAYLDAGGRKIDTWYAEHRLALADFSDRQELSCNVNTPDEQARVEQQLKLMANPYPA